MAIAWNTIDYFCFKLRTQKATPYRVVGRIGPTTEAQRLLYARHRLAQAFSINDGGSFFSTGQGTIMARELRRGMKVFGIFDGVKAIVLGIFTHNAEMVGIFLPEDAGAEGAALICGMIDYDTSAKIVEPIEADEYYASLEAAGIEPPAEEEDRRFGQPHHGHDEQPAGEKADGSEDASQEEGPEA